MRNFVLSVILVAIAAISLTSCNTNDPSAVRASLEKLNTYFESTGHYSVSDFTEEKESKIHWEAAVRYEPKDSTHTVYGPRVLDARTITVNDFNWILNFFFEGPTLEAFKDNNSDWNWRVTTRNGREITGLRAQMAIKNSIEEIESYLALAQN